MVVVNVVKEASLVVAVNVVKNDGFSGCGQNGGFGGCGQCDENDGFSGCG